MFKRLIAVSLMTLAALTSSRSTLAQTAVPRYYVTDLGLLPNADTSTPNAINDNGVVIGHTPLSRTVAYSRGWVWVPSASTPTQGTLNELKPAYASPHVLAYEICAPGSINNGGLIVGTSSSRDSTKVPRATYWTSPNAPVDFNTLLPAPSEWTLTRAQSVSEPGPAGELYVSGAGRHASDPGTDVGIVWCVSGGVITSITRLENAPGLTSPVATPTDMNSLGQMTGTSHSIPAGGSYHPFRWETNGQGQDLGSLGAGSTMADAINDAGVVVGWDTMLRRGWVWTPTTGPMTVLPTLGGTQSWASGINNLNQIVGFATTTRAQHACLWLDGKAYDVNSLKSAGATKTELIWAYEINNRSSIIAGYNAGKGDRSVLLTPQ